MRKVKNRNLLLHERIKILNVINKEISNRIIIATNTRGRKSNKHDARRSSKRYIRNTFMTL